MKVIIAGAGIAGLSAAIGLRRAGHEVLILDKSSLSHEVGAAIREHSLYNHHDSYYRERTERNLDVQPNASRIVARWGFDVKRARLVTAKSITLFMGDNLHVYEKIDLSNIEDEYGSGYFFSHRVDLHNELKLLATGIEGEGKPAVIQNRCEVVGYDTINGSAILADGTIMTADLIVGADGIHSSAVKEVTGYETPAVPTKISCFRCLMPVQEIRDDPECASFMEAMEGKLCMFTSPKDGRQRIVWYPYWNNNVPTETLLNELDDFHPTLRTLLSKAKDVRLWKLLFRAPLPTWHKGKLVVIGDAAHPMLPYQGQAGAQAIEDGCALGILFSNLPNTNPETISSRLTSFENVRRNRASAMQMFSNAGPDEAEKVKESVRGFMEEGVVIPWQEDKDGKDGVENEKC
ncbi:hypothetical protein SBOR_9838 [Sclerotinia borealis F-4128]|uniref:FAD-binding domain-containing protein n=1 Tax=Sclerotinia borealis (strain F-4128) TaxID=1432307 RepID=W9C237_SCLBF|nr:hypothetical protein SBOR_9838 [Sclerotinia borealis F-4128]